jgi:hypothetical protein
MVPSLATEKNPQCDATGNRSRDLPQRSAITTTLPQDTSSSIVGKSNQSYAMDLKSTRTWRYETNGNGVMHTKILTDHTCVISTMTFRMRLDVLSICDKYVNNIT